MNGGVCGRRAFFGRFILRAFGVPTIARPSRGHAALARFTPEGWVVCLGGGWGAGWTKTFYKVVHFHLLIISFNFLYFISNTVFLGGWPQAQWPWQILSPGDVVRKSTPKRRAKKVAARKSTRK